MTVTVCIASRGRPQECAEAVRQMLDSAMMPGTSISIAIDDDDPDAMSYFTLIPDQPCVRVDSKPRENSLGAKYNRSARNAPHGTSVYVLGVDDCYVTGTGWDEALLTAAASFDGVGAMFFGARHNHPIELAPAFAFTKGWIDAFGYFMPEHFPFWWHDTWVDELARMTGRFTWVDVGWEKHGASESSGGHKTTRMREVAWWARFFDETRVWREKQARDVLTDDSVPYPAWLRAQLLSDLPVTSAMLLTRNALVRTQGPQFERVYGATYEPDPGYDALRTDAERILKEMEK